MNGRITVLGTSSISLVPGTTRNQKICVSEPIETIQYTISNALLADVTGLPPGVTSSYNAATQRITIEGTPTDVVTQTTVYPYQA